MPACNTVLHFSISLEAVLTLFLLFTAIRKMKFFLHPDKLPRDFTDKQLLLCKVLWDVTSDAEEQQANTRTA